MDKSQIYKAPNSFYILMPILTVLNIVSCFCIQFVKDFKANIAPSLLYVYLGILLVFIVLAFVVNMIEKSKKFWYMNIACVACLISAVVFLILFL